MKQKLSEPEHNGAKNQPQQAQGFQTPHKNRSLQPVEGRDGWGCADGRYPWVPDQRRAYATMGLLSLTFLFGAFVSGCYFYTGRKFEWAAAIISDLQSPEENPRGYLVFALATAVTGMFFLRLARVFHGFSVQASVPAAWFGSVLFALGGCGALAIGSLAHFRHSYDTVHVPLAFATFIALMAGLGVHLALAGVLARVASQKWSAGLFAGAGGTVAILVTLARLYQLPDYFTGENLLTTLALWEWLLCASIVGFMPLLARANCLIRPRKSGSTP